jgi:hypothetical protein
VEPTAEAPATTETEPTSPDAVVEDQPTSVAPPEGTSAETGTETETPEAFEENFDPSTLPDELQQGYKQLQAAFTKKTQELAEQRKQAEGAQALTDALLSEDHQADAIKHIAETIGEDVILEALGIRLADDDDTEPGDGEQPELDPDDPTAALQQEIKRLQERLDQREQAEQTAAEKAAEEEHFAKVGEHVESELAKLGGDKGLSDEEKQLVVNVALANPADEHGMPRIAEAKALLDKVADQRLQGWAQSKDAPTVATATGVPASEAPDLDNEQQRIAHMVGRLAGDA